jgi:hypothetical protein
VSAYTSLSDSLVPHKRTSFRIPLPTTCVVYSYNAQCNKLIAQIDPISYKFAFFYTNILFLFHAVLFHVISKKNLIYRDMLRAYIWRFPCNRALCSNISYSTGCIVRSNQFRIKTILFFFVNSYNKQKLKMAYRTRKCASRRNTYRRKASRRKARRGGRTDLEAVKAAAAAKEREGRRVIP